MSAPMKQLCQAACINCKFPLFRLYTCSRLRYCTPVTELPKEETQDQEDKKTRPKPGFRKEIRQRVDKDGFRILESVMLPAVPPQFSNAERPKRAEQISSINRKPARYTQMPVDQDWTDVWPAAHTFKWSAVPLPVRQGHIKSRQEAAGDGLPPAKYGNLELMKIPNFLHLTPDHIRKHCQAIKKYTTAWPKDLENEDVLAEKFPLEIKSSDYCFSGPSIRDERARVVTIKFPLKSLRMDEHGVDKFIKLVENKFTEETPKRMRSKLLRNTVKVVVDRYNKETGFVTMKMDRCPLKTQNLEYLMYQLTALFFESTTEEPWEDSMTDEDMLYPPWGSDNARKTLEILLKQDTEFKEMESSTEVQDLVEKRTKQLKEDLVKRVEAKPVMEKVYNYKIASEQLLKGQSEKSDIDNYKQAVLKLMNLNKPTDQESQGQNS